MRGYVVERCGKGASLQLKQLPDPVCGPDDILVEIHAASLNPLDGEICDGAFKPILPYKPPFILGHDLAGAMAGIGARVTHFKIGDEVFARPRDGRIGAFAFEALNEALAYVDTGPAKGKIVVTMKSAS